MTQPASTNQPVQAPQPTSLAPLSGLAVASLVLGIIALLISFLPIVNNLSFLLAVLGVILGIVGIVGASKGKRRGKGLAIAGVVLGVASCIIVLATQNLYSAAIDSVTTGETASVASSDPAAEAQSAQDLAIGTTATLSNGLEVSVDAVQTDLANYDGSPMVGITVTYRNTGSSSASFNVYDWKVEDAQGAQRSQAYYSEAQDELSSGTLAAGGTVSGNIYFDDGATKALYFSSIVASEPSASWVL